MKRKTVIGTVVMVLLLAGTAACAKKPEEQNRTGTFRQEGNHVTAEYGEFLKVDAEVVNAPEKEKYEVLHTKWENELTQDEFVSALFPGETDLNITDATVITSDGTSAMATYSLTGRLFEYQTSDWIEKAYRTLLGMWNSDQNLKRWPESLDDIPDTELNGYPKEQAIADAKAVLDRLGLPLEEKPYAAYGVNAESLRYMLETLEKSRNLSEIPGFELPEYEEEDGCYCLFWYSEINGVPVVSGNYPTSANEYCSVRGEAERGCSTFVVIAKKGILYIESISNQFFVESMEEPEEIRPLEEIMEAIPVYYQDMLLAEEHTVSRANFCYIPVVTKTGDRAEEYRFDLVPGWCLEASYKIEGKKQVYWDLIYVNAVTGEIIS